MIAKHVPSPKASRGFTDLARYVVNARHGVPPASWERLGAYILDANGEGEKVEFHRVTNCEADDPGWATREIAATQARNTRSKADKSYHLVVSFPEGERPTRAQLEDIEDRLCEAIRFGEHQRISAVHHNTAHYHLHVAINKVHPRTFRNVAPYRDHFRLQEACAELERKHGLTVEPHTLDPQQARARDASARASEFQQWVSQHAREPLLNAKEKAADWQDIHKAAAAFDLVVKPRRAGLAVVHRAMSRLSTKASAVDPGLSMKALTDKLGPYQPPAHEPVRATMSFVRPGSVYDRFIRERDAVAGVRKAAAADLRAAHENRRAYLKEFYGRRFEREQLLHPPGSFLRRESFQTIADQRRAAFREQKHHEAEDWRKLREGVAVPRWETWLQDQAKRGDAEAIKALGTRQKRGVEAGELAQDQRHGQGQGAQQKTAARSPQRRDAHEHDDGLGR